MPESALRQAAVVGLGWTGQCYGLALRRAYPYLQVTGHDKHSDAGKAAQKSGAVQRTHWNLISACEQAQLIVLALPAGEALATLKALAKELAPGALVTDSAHLKAAIAAWADESLPAGALYVPGHPLLRPAAEPSAAAFESHTYCLTPSQHSDPAAVSAVAGLAELLGAKVTFLEPQEHDSLMIALEQLPALSAAAMLHMLQASQPRTDLHWLREALPAEVLSLAERAGDSGSGLTPVNRESLAHWLGQLEAALAAMRRALMAGEDQPLAKLLGEAQEAALRWLPEARHDDGTSPQEPPAGGGSWRRMLGMR